MTLAIVLTVTIWLAAGLFLARGCGCATRPAPPFDPDACWGCEVIRYGRGAAHTCGPRAGEWRAESRTRGGRP